MHPVKYDEWLKIKDFIPKEDIWIDKNGEYFKKSQYAKEYKLDDVLINENVIWIPNYVIKSPRECKSIIVNPKDLKSRVLLIHKDKEELRGTNVLKYIEWGEEQGFHERPTCKSREKWYDLGVREPAKILFLRATENKPAIYICPSGVLHDQTFYSIYPKEVKSVFVIALLLNSTLINYFFRELISGAGTALGMGALWSAVYEVSNFPFIDLSKLTTFHYHKLEKLIGNLNEKKVLTVFKELGTEDPEKISINRVDFLRRTLDEIVIQEILGFKMEDQLELYKAVIDLVKTRIERARSVVKRKKKKGVDIEALANGIVSRLNTKIEKFPDAYISDYKGLWSKKIKIPKGQPTFGSDINGFYVQIEGKEVYRGWDHDEAKFIYFAALTGASIVKLPLDKNALITALEAFEKNYRKLKEEVDTLLSTMISDVKVRKEVKDKVWSLLFSRQAV